MVAVMWPVRLGLKQSRVQRAVSTVRPESFVPIQPVESRLTVLLVGTPWLAHPIVQPVSQDLPVLIELSLPQWLVELGPTPEGAKLLARPARLVLPVLLWIRQW